MRNGYLRLQAVIRSRILSHRFKHLRGHIIRLQARSRGYLIRREITRKKWAVIKIQSNVKRMIAQRDYRRMRVERRARQEALRLKEEEARALEKQLGKKKAREEAEKKFQQRIDDFERQEQEQEDREKEKIQSNLKQIARAQFKEDQPVDDSAVVDDMFGFLESQNDNMSESQAPSAFRDLPAPKTLQKADIFI